MPTLFRPQDQNYKDLNKGINALKNIIFVLTGDAETDTNIDVLIFVSMISVFGLDK